MEQTCFLNLLSKTNPDAIVLSTYTDYSTPFKWLNPTSSGRAQSFPKPLKRILAEVDLAEGWNAEDLASVMDIDNISNVETATMDQSSNPLWYGQRAGRITASKAHSVLHTSLVNPSKSLLSTICDSTVTVLNVPALKWGREKESLTVKMFTDYFTGDNEVIQDKIMTNGLNQVRHQNPINGAGFRICQEFPWIGASPDGHVACECCGLGILEVKCPFKYADVGLNKDFFNDKSSHLETTGSLKEVHPYYTQVQLQMYVCKVKLRYFMTWTPMNCCISKVQHNEDFVADMVQRLNKFWITCVFPKLTSTSDSGEESPPTMPLSMPIYCKCQKVKDEPMVGCDNNTCKFKWFHFSCVSLKTKPRKKVWFCSKACMRKSKM